MSEYDHDNGAYWHALKSGNKANLPMNTIPLGFFKTTKTGKVSPPQPIAFWLDEVSGELYCKKGHHMLEDRLLEEAEWLGEKSYLSQEDYNAWFENDGAWTANKTPPIGHNNPPDELEQPPLTGLELAKQEYALILATSKKELGEKELADLKEVAGKLSRESDKARERIKAPHFQAAKAVDDAWQPIIKGAKNIADDANRKAGAIVKERADKERIIREAAAAKLRELKKDTPELAVVAATFEAAPVKIEVMASSGKVSTYKEVDVFHLTNQAALFTHYMQDPRFITSDLVLEVLTRLAKADLKSGTPVNGAEFRKEGRI